MDIKEEVLSDEENSDIPLNTIVVVKQEVEIEYDKEPDQPCASTSQQNIYIEDTKEIKSEIFQCRHCSESFTDSVQLTEHEQIHVDEILFKCEICMKEFSYKNLKHDENGKLVCDTCESAFTQPISLPSVHSSSDNYYVTRTNSYWEDNPDDCRYLSHTGDKEFECEICKKTFTRLYSLNSHRQTVHIGEKPFECYICNKKFPKMPSLQGHIRMHTGEKPYECEFCEKKFYRPSALSEHRLVHSGVKPYECNSCDKKFLNSSSLKDHIRTHTGEKPFECEICNKKFARSPALKQHIRIHTGEKPYECDICNKKFSQTSALKRHKTLHVDVK